MRPTGSRHCYLFPSCQGPSPRTYFRTSKLGGWGQKLGGGELWGWGRRGAQPRLLPWPENSAAFKGLKGETETPCFRQPPFTQPLAWVTQQVQGHGGIRRGLAFVKVIQATERAWEK